MSHFKVMVIGENPETQLAPFNQNLEVPRYVKYTKEELVAKGREEISKYYPERKWTDKEIYMNEVFGYEPEDIGNNGEIYSTYNPNSKWDWYSLGGRWSGSIKLKEGKQGECGRSGIFGNEVGIDRALKGDIANFDELMPFAVVKDGKWYEKGEMGYWAIVFNEDKDWNSKFLKLVENLSDDTLISMYDCHI